MFITKLCRDHQMLRYLTTSLTLILSLHTVKVVVNRSCSTWLEAYEAYQRSFQACASNVDASHNIHDDWPAGAQCTARTPGSESLMHQCKFGPVFLNGSHSDARGIESFHFHCAWSSSVTSLATSPSSYITAYFLGPTGTDGEMVAAPPVFNHHSSLVIGATHITTTGTYFLRGDCAATVGYLRQFPTGYGMMISWHEGAEMSAEFRLMSMMIPEKVPKLPLVLEASVSLQFGKLRPLHAPMVLIDYPSSPWIQLDIDTREHVNSSGDGDVLRGWSKGIMGTIIEDKLVIEYASSSAPHGGYPWLLPPHAHYVAIEFIGIFVGEMNTSGLHRCDPRFSVRPELLLDFNGSGAQFATAMIGCGLEPLCRATASGHLGKHRIDRDPTFRCHRRYISKGETVTLICASRTPSFYPDSAMIQHCGPASLFLLESMEREAM